MRVLVIHNLYRWRGGEDDMALRLADLLEANGNAVHRCFADSRELDGYTRLQKARAALEAMHSEGTVRRLNATIDQFKPDVAHVFNVLPLLSPSVYQLLAQRGVPVVQSIQNFRFLCPSSLGYTHGQVCLRCQTGNTLPAIRLRCCHNDLTQSVLYAVIIAAHRRFGTLGNKTGHLLPVNSLLARLLHENFPQAQITVMPNFIETGRFEPRTGFGLSFAFLGRLFPEKGVATLLEALARVPRVKLDIVGEGLLESELKDRAGVLAAGRVTFHGYQAGDGRFAPLRRAMALVLPSVSHDACPLVALEAMALGVPVIASRLGGLPDLVKDGHTGRLFEAGQASELATLMQELVDSPDTVRAMGAAARRRAETVFDAGAYYARLARLYGDIIG
jgi:glycosyltransferase involved in cell wall biosynthesis